MSPSHDKKIQHKAKERVTVSYKGQTGCNVRQAYQTKL